MMHDVLRDTVLSYHHNKAGHRTGCIMHYNMICFIQYFFVFFSKTVKIMPILNIFNFICFLFLFKRIYDKEWKNIVQK